MALLVAGAVALPSSRAQEQAGLAELSPDEPGTVPYVTDLAPTGDATLDEALAAVSRLQRLQEEAPTSAFGLASAWARRCTRKDIGAAPSAS
jgi:hypothetical protein